MLPVAPPTHTIDDGIEGAPCVPSLCRFWRGLSWGPLAFNPAVLDFIDQLLPFDHRRPHWRSGREERFVFHTSRHIDQHGEGTVERRVIGLAGRDQLVDGFGFVHCITLAAPAEPSFRTR